MSYRSLVRLARLYTRCGRKAEARGKATWGSERKRIFFENPFLWERRLGKVRASSTFHSPPTTDEPRLWRRFLSSL